MSRQISVIAIERWRKGTYILKALTGPNTGKNYFPNGEWKSGGRTKGKRFNAESAYAFCKEYGLKLARTEPYGTGW